MTPFDERELLRLLVRIVESGSISAVVGGPMATVLSGVNFDAMDPPL